MIFLRARLQTPQVEIGSKPQMLRCHEVQRRNLLESWPVDRAAEPAGTRDSGDV